LGEAEVEEVDDVDDDEGEAGRVASRRRRACVRVSRNWNAVDGCARSSSAIGPVGAWAGTKRARNRFDSVTNSSSGTRTRDQMYSSREKAPDGVATTMARSSEASESRTVDRDGVGRRDEMVDASCGLVERKRAKTLRSAGLSSEAASAR